MLPETHPRLKARCRGQSTLSTAVDEETKRWLAQVADEAGVSPAEALRRFIDYARANETAVRHEVDL